MPPLANDPDNSEELYENLRDAGLAKMAQGDQFSLRAFDDYLWKNGNVPIALQRWEYLDKDDDIRVLDNRKTGHHWATAK